jgi:transposase
MLSLSRFIGLRCSPVRVGGERGATRTRHGIVAEIVASGESVSAVARRHGLSPQQLFGWRRELQASQTALSHAEELRFVPAVLDVAPSSPSVRRQRKVPRGQGEPGAGMIEVEIDGVRIRVGRGADTKTVRAVLRTLKARA